MTNLPRRLRIMAILVLLTGYVLLNHHLARQKQTGNLATLVACLPLLLAGASLAWRQPTFRVRAILLLALVTLPAIGWPLLKSHPANIYMTQHVALFGGLAIWFGRSLFSDRQALCTRFARFDQPVMTDAILRYTRRVTLAWTIFFVAMVSTSVSLFLWSSVSVWSLFANFFFAATGHTHVCCRICRALPSIARGENRYHQCVFCLSARHRADTAETFPVNIVRHEAACQLNFYRSSL